MCLYFILFYPVTDATNNKSKTTSTYPMKQTFFLYIIKNKIELETKKEKIVKVFHSNYLCTFMIANTSFHQDAF